jgi:hypothetical protein
VPAKYRGAGEFVGRALGIKQSNFDKIRQPTQGGIALAHGLRVLRISRVDQNATLCLRVEGRLTGDWVDLLEGELAEAFLTTDSVSLDLAGVDFASLQATEVLRAATVRGVRVVACSPFLAKLLLTSTP